MKERRPYCIDGLLLFLLTAALIWPLYRLKYLTNWGLIEGCFISQARFLMAHWPHPRWQPLWYCGTRFDYVYPPALHYGTVILAKLFGLIPARAYHMYIAICYCIGSVGVYLLVRVGSRSRGAAWLAAAASVLVSPAFLFIPDVRTDARLAHWIPQRLNALIRYAEGPHISAFALVPIALAAGMVGLRKGRPGALALCAVFSALVVSNNFYGATALAILFPVLVWALWICEQDHRTWLRAALVTALAYGLTAPWLTPSYLRVTMRNMKFVSEAGNKWSIWVALAVAALFAAASVKLARGKRERVWVVFLAGSLVFMSLNVLGNHYFNFRVIGEPGRHIPELDLAMILVAVECLRRLCLWKVRFHLTRIAAAAIVLVCLSPARHYLAHAWEYYPREPDYRTRVEWRMTDIMAQDRPDFRALATGSVRFWYTAWNDIPQVGGASEQGTLNEQVNYPYFVVTQDKDPEHYLLALRAVGASAIIVHGKKSQEPYKDYAFPETFAGVLPVIYGNDQDDAIWGVTTLGPGHPRPLHWWGLVHVVEAARVRALRPVNQATYYDDLRPYVATMDKGSDVPITLRWEGPERMVVSANLSAGQGVLIQESYDPSWHAYADGKPVRIERDPMNFMLLEPPPGARDVALVFELPLENLVGYIIFGITAAALAWLAWRAKFRQGW